MHFSIWETIITPPHTSSRPTGHCLRNQSQLLKLNIPRGKCVVKLPGLRTSVLCIRKQCATVSRVKKVNILDIEKSSSLETVILTEQETNIIEWKNL